MHAQPVMSYLLIYVPWFTVCPRGSCPIGKVLLGQTVNTSLKRIKILNQPSFSDRKQEFTGYRSEAIQRQLWRERERK